MNGPNGGLADIFQRGQGGVLGGVGAAWIVRFRQKQRDMLNLSPSAHDPGRVKTPACLARVEHLKAIAGQTWPNRMLFLGLLQPGADITPSAAPVNWPPWAAAAGAARWTR